MQTFNLDPSSEEDHHLGKWIAQKLRHMADKRITRFEGNPGSERSEFFADGQKIGSTEKGALGFYERATLPDGVDAPPKEELVA